MKVSLLAAALLTICCLLMFKVTSFEVSSTSNGSSKILEKHSKLHQHLNLGVDDDGNLESLSILRVSTYHYEPFMYQDEIRTFYKGIEYQLIKTIAEKKRLNLLIKPRKQHIQENIKQLLFKYEFILF